MWITVRHGPQPQHIYHARGMYTEIMHFLGIFYIFHVSSYKVDVFFLVDVHVW